MLYLSTFVLNQSNKVGGPELAYSGSAVQFEGRCDMSPSCLQLPQRLGGNPTTAVSPWCWGNSFMSFSSNCWSNSVENLSSRASGNYSHTVPKGSSHPQLGSTVLSRNSKLTQPPEVDIQKVFKLATSPLRAHSFTCFRMSSFVVFLIG